MRNQIMRQRQNVAHKAIQPIFTYPHHKTEQILERINCGMFNTTLRLQTNNKKSLNNDPFKSKTINHNQLIPSNGLQKDRCKQKQQLKTSNLIKYQKNPNLSAILSNECLQQREKAVSNIQHTFQGQFKYSRKKDKVSQFTIESGDINNFEVQSKDVLLKNIQILRLSEKKYITSVDDYQFEDYSNDSPHYFQTLEGNTCTTQDINEDQQGNKTNNNLKLKQKIKIRQSKKNIYRILKNKNDNMNKIKLKNRNFQKDTPNANFKDIKQIQLLRLHCPQAKHPYNIRSNKFRSLTKKHHSNIRDFREQIKHKSQEKMPILQLRSTKCQFLNSRENQEESKFLKRKKIEIYDEIVSRMKQEGNIQVLMKTKQDKIPPIKNMFRELTPWCLDQ